MLYSTALHKPHIFCLSAPTTLISLLLLILFTLVFMPADNNAAASNPFPLRGFAVDDDRTSLVITKQTLHSRNYEVMSADAGKEAALEGFVYGAGDYLVKPMQPWQQPTPVIENESSRIGHWKGEESKALEANPLAINSGDKQPSGEGVSGLSNSKVSKRKREEKSSHQESSSNYQTNAKKPRLIWAPPLHNIFVDAVKSLTVEKAVPKKILEKMRNMGVNDITRENVASHLQKYRLHLKRKNQSNSTAHSVSLNAMKESNFKISPIDQRNFHCSPTGHLPEQRLTGYETDFISTNQLPPPDPHRIMQWQPPTSHHATASYHGIVGFQNLPNSLSPPMPSAPHVNNIWPAVQQPQPQPQLYDDNIFYTQFAPTNDTLHSLVLPDQFPYIDESGLYRDFGMLCNDILYDSPLNFVDDYRFNNEALSFENLQVDECGNAPEMFVSNAPPPPQSFGSANANFENEGVVVEMMVKPSSKPPGNVSNDASIWGSRG